MERATTNPDADEQCVWCDGTLADSIDASTATLGSAIVGDEDAATVTYTVTLSTAPTVDETFTFDVDGVERTITV